MSRFFWVRHGPTHAKTMVGWSDLPADLGNTGKVARLAAHLPDDAMVVSSDLVRSVATADAVAGERARLAHDPDLREIHFGDWELKPVDAIPDQAHLRAFWDAPGDVRPPGGESWHDVVARVDRAVSGLMDAHPGRDIIAVAHFGVILTQLQQALELDTPEAFGHKIDNLSMTELIRVGSGWQVGRINHCP